MTRLISGALAGVVALGFMAAAALVAPRDLVLLLGGDAAVPAATVALLAWGVGVVFVAVAIAIVVLRRTRPRTPAIPVAGLVMIIAVAALCGARVLDVFVVQSGDEVLSGEQYVVIRPPAGVACGLIVGEGSFIASSGGEIYVVDGAGVGRLVSTWSGDDVQRPLEAPGSGVTWRSSGGTLHLQGSAVQPSRLDFTCTG